MSASAAQRRRVSAGDADAVTSETRIQKVLAARGVASRRKAETLVTQGRVQVDGEIVRELGARVPANARIEVDGKRVPPPPAHRYVVLNKPRGVVATTRDELGRPTVV